MQINLSFEEAVFGTKKTINVKLALTFDYGQKAFEEENELNNLSLEEHYKYYEKQGLDKKEIIKKIAKDRNVNKNEIYMKFI